MRVQLLIGFEARLNPFPFPFDPRTPSTRKSKHACMSLRVSHRHASVRTRRDRPHRQSSAINQGQKFLGGLPYPD
jgi:hypothetical protein